ncbi:MAG: hypothetical protein ACQESG_04840 [Nanobdellota archaeon]
MGLTNKREEQIKKMPYIETKVEKSKDGRYLINRTTITHVRPVEYYQAVLDGEKVESEPSELTVSN